LASVAGTDGDDPQVAAHSAGYVGVTVLDAYHGGDCHDLDMEGEMTTLFIGFEPQEGDTVLYLGCHALRWQDHGDPQMAFVPICEDQLTEFARLCREYPKEAVGNLVEEVFRRES